MKSKIETLQMSLEQKQQENARLEQEKTRSREERDAIFEEVTRLRNEKVVDSCNAQALIVAVRSDRKKIKTLEHQHPNTDTCRDGRTTPITKRFERTETR